MTIRYESNATLYELLKGRKPNVRYLHVFGSKCYILVDHEQRRKMNPNSEEGIFLGYSVNIRAYSVFNSHAKTMMEYIKVIIDDNSEEKKVVKEKDDIILQPADV